MSRARLPRQRGVGAALATDQPSRGTRVIAYVRVSDFKHGEGLSPDVQIREIRRYCEREGLVLVAVVGLTQDLDGVPAVVDLDLSGRTSTKRKVSPMIDAIEGEQADGVVVWKISRWGRSMLDSLLNIKDLHDAGGYILSTSENLNEIDTPAGKLTLGMALLIAQFQSDQIGEVWENIRDYRWGEGVPATGGPRWGYIWNRDLPISDERYYEINEALAPWVKQCYIDYVAGKSFADLVRFLREKDVRSTTGGEITEGTLRQIMDTGFAAGKLVRYPRARKTGKIRGAGPRANTYLPGKQPTIIDEDLWQQYVAKRLLRTGAPSRRGITHPFSGLLRCSSCDSTLTLYGAKGGAGKYYWYFTCVRGGKAATKLTAKMHCAMPARIRDVTADAKIWAEIHDVAEHRDDINRQYQREATVTKATVDLKRIKKEIDDLEKRRARAYSLLLDGVTDKDVYQKDDEDMKTRLAELHVKKAQAEVSSERTEIPDVTVFTALDRMRGVLDAPDLNTALRQIIRKVTVINEPHPGRRAADPTIKIQWMWERD